MVLPQAKITLVGLPWAAQFAERFERYIDDFVAFPGHPAFPEQTTRETALPGFYADMCNRGFNLALQLHGNGKISNSIVRQFGARVLAGFAIPGASAETNEVLVNYPQCGAEPARLLHLIAHLGAPADHTNLEFPITTDDELELQRAGLSADCLPRDYICVHPGASTISKCWPAQCFAEVADALSRRFGVAVVLTGSDKEAELTARVAWHMRMPAIDAAAPISIGAMAALMRRARLLVCNDTGVSHIAAGLGLPSVVVFITADIERWAPLNQALHKCIRDPQGEQASVVVEFASSLLAEREKSFTPSDRPATIPAPDPALRQATHRQEN